MIRSVTKELSKDFLETLDHIPLEKLSMIAEGYYGKVYSLRAFGKRYALKVFKDTMKVDLKNGVVAAYDYEILKKLGKSKFYPTLHAYKENEWMIVEWVEGIVFRNVQHKELYFTELQRAYKTAVQAGWFPDDVKGSNLVLNRNSQLMILDVGSFLPFKDDIEYDIDERVVFVLENAWKYPSVRDQKPYDLSGAD